MDTRYSFLYFWKMDGGHRLPIRINSAGLSHCAPDWSWDSSLVPWFDDDLWFVGGGRGTLETPEGIFDLQRGDCFVLRGGYQYRGTQDPLQPLTVCFIHFSGHQSLPALHRRLENADFLEALLERVVLHWRRGEVQKACQWLESALLELGGGATDHGPPSAVSVDQRQQITRLCADIHSQPDRSYRIGDWASEFGLSRQHFCRVFKAVMGLSPRDYLIGVRIETAKVLLHHSDHPLKRVAALCGFQDEFYFSRSFRRETGVSPGKFREGRLE